MAIAANGGSGTTTPKPKVLIPEKVSPDGIALLQKSLDVHEKKGLSPEELIKIIPEYDALIVRSETKVTAALLNAAKKLKVVARAGVGVDNVDVTTATKLGIIVVNSPSGNINAAAEQTVALMMASARNVAEACSSTKAGKWERSKFVGVELKGKTLAIVGVGKVGMTVARIANGFGMNVVAYDPYANPAIAAASNVTLKETLYELFPLADFFTIHTPLLPTTKGMIGASELSSMKPTARIMNVARGGMIDEEALLTALNEGRLAGAGIDVFTSEPAAPDSSAARLIAHPKVVSTPHLGASTIEAQENVSIDVCEQVLHIISGQLPRSAVNAPLIMPEEYRTLQPFVTLVEKMGTIYTQHYGSKHVGGIKDFRTTFDLSYEGAIASLNTTKPLFAALIKGLVSSISADVNVNLVNAELVAKERGILINEFRSREPLEEEGFSSYVTLRARLGRSSSQPPTPSVSGMPRSEQIIQGYVSHNTPFISRLDRFRTNFVPDGNLLMCRNIDTPGKVGMVGMRLGQVGVNINSMTVARLENGMIPVREEKEALMILGVDREVDMSTIEELVKDQAILEGSLITL